MIRLFVYVLIFITVLVSVCIHTKPDREEHLRELSSSLLENIDAVSPVKGVDADEFVAEVLDKLFVVEEYVALTVGSIVYGGEKYVISVGVLGNVFTLSKDDVTERVVRRLRERGIVD